MSNLHTNALDDVFDPNTWSALAHHAHRLYLDDHAQFYVVLDEIDYAWAIQHRWARKPSRGGRKFYAYRNATRNGRQHSLYLHVEIMRRCEVLPPSLAHHIVDHRNGNSMDCRRNNLRWATAAMNRKNIFGSFPHDLLEG